MKPNGAMWLKTFTNMSWVLLSTPRASPVWAACHLVCPFLQNAETLYTHVVLPLLLLVSDPHRFHVKSSELALVCLLVGVMLSLSSPKGKEILRALSLAV